jgi:predicted HTH transcriptional regulator
MTQDEVLRYLTEQYPESPTQREMAKALGNSVSTINEQIAYLKRKEKVVQVGNGIKDRRYVAHPREMKGRLADLQAQITEAWA